MGTDLGEMEKFKTVRLEAEECPDCGHYLIDANFIELHKKIEQRISEEPTTSNFDQFGLNGDIYEWLKKDIVLKIIEEEFGRLGNI